LSSLGGKTPNLGEELNKVKDELNGKIGKMKNRASSLDSLNSLKDKISNLSNNSSRNSSYSHSLRKKSEGKKRISITQGPFVVSPICIDSSEGQGSSYFEPQNNQNLTIDSNSISDNQEISENFNNISYDDYEALKKEKDKLKKELMITKGQLHKANLERDECRNQEVKSEEINSLRTEQLNNTKKKIKELKEEIRKIKENSRVFANQQIIEESPILNIDNINQNLEKREELEAVIETIIVRN
jgi:hypothetical protein